MQVLEVEDWPTYVRRIAAGLTQAQIAAKVGSVSTSNVGRWLRGEPGQPAADNVIAFARAFDQSVIEALIAARYLSPQENGATARTPLSQYTRAELLDELLRREHSG
jgi:transcriptional regulator with XRE-family HTH domain